MLRAMQSTKLLPLALCCWLSCSHSGKGLALYELAPRNDHEGYEDKSITARTLRQLIERCLPRGNLVSADGFAFVAFMVVVAPRLVLGNASVSELCACVYVLMCVCVCARVSVSVCARERTYRCVWCMYIAFSVRLCAPACARACVYLLSGGGSS